MVRLKVNLIDGKKQCSKCKEVKELLYFRVHQEHSTGYRSQCKKCESFYVMARRIKVPRKRREKIDYKGKILSHYGLLCLCCGENNPILLTVDHINNNGKEHGTIKRRYKGSALYRYLVKNDYPIGIQILCFNCNIGKRNNKGVCPHQTV